MNINDYRVVGTHPTNPALNFEEFFPTKEETKQAIGARLANSEGWYLSYFAVSQITEANYNAVTIINTP